MRTLASPLSQMGVEPGECLSRGESGQDLTSFLKKPLLDRSVSPQEPWSVVETTEGIKSFCS